MKEDITVSDAADAVGIQKQALFKVLKRMGLQTIKRKSDQHRGQTVSYLSHADFEFLTNNYAPATTGGGNTNGATDDGWFYLIQLEPEHDPGRIKLGFAVNLNDRLRQHRCAAPFAAVLDSWPCRSLWEKTVIDCVSQDCEQLHTEVFRTEDIDHVRRKCEAFFELMPLPKATQQAASDGRPSGATEL